MFLSQLKLRDAGDGVWEVVEPLVFATAAEDAPPGISVPAGFQTDFRFIPPPAREWIIPVGPATGPAVIYAYLRRSGLERHVAMDVFQDALRVNGVPKPRRSLLLLSL